MNIRSNLLTLSCLMLFTETSVAQDASTYDSLQLDLMLAPIALYPDPLMVQVLIASTYPLQIVAADRWMLNPDMASWTSDEVSQSLASQGWDSSVKSLIGFPDLVRTLDDNLSWTEAVGRAFTIQQADVMASIQDLRAHAQQAGSLRSTLQQNVSIQGSDILIEPTDPEHISVPDFNPQTAYGPWQPQYQPYVFSHTANVTPDVISVPQYVVIAQPYWGYYNWSWRARSLHGAHHMDQTIGSSGDQHLGVESQTNVPHQRSDHNQDQPTHPWNSPQSNGPQARPSQDPSPNPLQTHDHSIQLPTTPTQTQPAQVPVPIQSHPQNNDATKNVLNGSPQTPVTKTVPITAPPSSPAQPQTLTPAQGAHSPADKTGGLVQP